MAHDHDIPDDPESRADLLERLQFEVDQDRRLQAMRDSLDRAAPALLEACREAEALIASVGDSRKDAALLAKLRAAIETAEPTPPTEGRQ